MLIKKLLKNLQDKYILNEGEDIKIPEFKRSDVVRRNIIFSGKVQKVGFRYELYLIATKLKLTGWVKNRDDGKVEAEIQGERDKIEFLKTYMCSLKRIKVTDIKEVDIPVKDEEKEFITVY